MPRRKGPGPGGAREGAGRPPLGADARSETVRVRVTPAMREEIAAVAKRAGLKEGEWGLAAFERELARARR